MKIIAILAGLVNGHGKKVSSPVPSIAHLSSTIPAAGTTIVLAYSLPVVIGAGGSGGHTLTMSGGPATMTYSSGSGTAALTYNLSRTVASAETGALAYVQPVSGVEEAVYRVDVDSFAGRAVTNSSIADPPPSIVSVTINSAGTSIALLYSSAVRIGVSGAGGHTLTMSGGAVTMSYVSGGDTSTLNYSLSRAVSIGETGTLAFLQPSNGIESLATGADVVTFSGQALTNSSVQPPTVVAVSIASVGTSISIAYTTEVEFGGSGSSGHTLSASGGTSAMSSPSGVGTKTLTYALARTVISTETATLAYTQPTDGVQAVSGAKPDKTTFSGQAVTNSSTQVAPTQVSATINSAGTQLSVGYSAAVAFGAGGNGGHVVTMSGGASAMTYVSGSGSSVLIYSLARIINSGETGALAYTQPGSGIESPTSLADVATYSGRSVSNGSTVGASSGTLATTFQLTSTLTGTHPFCIGHACKQAEVPSGTGVAVSGATAQVTTKNFWPDGSLKFALIAGTVPLTANVASTVSIAAGTASSGTALTTTDLRTAMLGQTCSIACGAFGTASWATTDFDSPAYTHVTGHRMSSWQFRKPVGADAHLVAWLEVRLYAGGAVEILPWVEVGFISGTAPVNKSATYAFTLGSTQRFSAGIDVKALTRIPLLTGTGVFSHWLGADPQVTPTHNAAYLKATQLVPNYNATVSPNAATLNAQLQAYSPNTLASVPSQMGNAGQSAALISNAQASYITSNGDARAWRSALVYGFSGGSWSTHYRDAATHAVPKFGSYPNATLGTVPAHTGGENGTPVTTHQPSFGYCAYLISGWFWFWEESAFWTTWNYLDARVRSRQGEITFETGPFRNASGSAGVIDPTTGAYANRGARWAMRTLAQTLALCPPSHPTAADWQVAWEANMDFYRAAYVDGTFAPGWVSPMGFLGDYSSSGASLYGSTFADNSWWGAGWMSAFAPQVLGFASDLGLPQSATSLANHLAVRNHSYKQVVERAGDGLGGNYNWRRFGVYSFPVGSDATGLPPETWYTSAEAYSHYLIGEGLSALPATAGLSLKAHTSNNDMVAGDTTATDYGRFAMASLTYAVNHAAPGAVAGWNRIAGASNFAAFIDGNDPGHVFAPRVSTTAPAHIVAAPEGQWTAIGTNTLTTVAFDYTGWGVAGYSTAFQSIMNAWSGATYDAVTHRLFVNGGGHGDYAGSETYAFNVQLNAWARLDNPSRYVETDFTGGANNPNNWNGVFPDNGPQPIHTYDVLSVNPTTGKMYRLGISGSAALKRIQEFNPALATQQAPGVTRAGWAYKATINWQDGSHGTSAWMSDENQFLIGAQDSGTFIGFRRYNPATDVVGATIAAIPGGFSTGDASMAYSASRRLAVYHCTQASANQLVLCNTATNSLTLQTVTGATLPSRVGMEYDTVRDRFIAYNDEGADRRVLYSIHPTTWVATQITPSAGATIGAPPGTDYRGIFGRFAYCADYDVFIAVNNVTGNVYLYKPTGWSPP